MVLKCIQMASKWSAIFLDQYDPSICLCLDLPRNTQVLKHVCLLDLAELVYQGGLGPLGTPNLLPNIGIKFIFQFYQFTSTPTSNSHITWIRLTSSFFGYYHQDLQIILAFQYFVTAHAVRLHCRREIMNTTLPGTQPPNFTWLGHGEQG